MLLLLGEDCVGWVVMELEPLELLEPLGVELPLELLVVVLAACVTGEWFVRFQAVTNTPSAAAIKPRRSALRGPVRRGFARIVGVRELFLAEAGTGRATRGPAEASVTSPAGCATQLRI